MYIVVLFRSGYELVQVRSLPLVFICSDTCSQTKAWLRKIVSFVADKCLFVLHLYSSPLYKDSFELKLSMSLSFGMRPMYDTHTFDGVRENNP